MRVARHYLSLSLAFFSTLVFFSQVAFAQLPQAGDTTSPPNGAAGHDYIHAPGETVSPANGLPSIRIPLRVPSGRELTIPLSIAYDAAGGHYYGSDQLNSSPHWATPKTVPFSQGGWSYTFPLVTSTTEEWYETNGVKNFLCHEWVNFVFQDPTGNRHNLGLTPVNSPGSFFTCGESPGILSGGEGPISASTSSAYSNFTRPVYVSDGNGTTYSFNPPNTNLFQSLPSTITDRNGNTVSIAVSGSPTISSATVTDTVGRTAISVGTFGGSPDNISVAGLSSTYQISWTTASASFGISVFNIPGSSGCATSLSGSASVVSQVVLPNGQKYTFTYDPTYGMLSKVTYPTGGYVRYVWGLNPQAQALQYNVYDNNGNFVADYDCRYDFPAISDRYVSTDGTTEVLHQHFSYSTTWSGTTDQYTSKTTTVTTYDLVRNTNFNTTYTYSPIGAPCVIDLNPNSNTGCVGDFTQQIPVEKTVQYYGTNGSLLRTVTKSWFNSDLRLLGSEQTTLDNGQSSLTVNCYNGNEQLTETDSYDLGTSTPTLPSCASGVPAGTLAGPLLRKTTKAYAAFAASIVDLPSSVITYDGSGNRVAETDTSYDQSALQTTSVVQHVSGGSSRGNVTTVTKQCFVGATACASGNLTTTFTYFDTGQIYQMTDPNNHVTTDSYTDSYSSCGGHAPPSGASNAYLTQVTYPQTSGVNHIVSHCYDYTPGLMLSSTDQNNLVTTYKYVDSLDRLTETDLPDGGKTTISYNDTPPTPSVTTSKKINSSGLTVTSVAITNGLGLVKQTQLTSDPQGTIYTDTTYDGLGRVYTVSNPYRTGGDPTTSSGTTTLYYDALSRKCLEVPPDGTLPSGGGCPSTQPANTIFTTYSGNSTTVTDQTGKSRKSFTDGLGRMTQVFEDPAGVNYETDYRYDALGNLLCAGQKGTNSGTFTTCTSIPSGWHPRTFSYDSLSRLLTSNNPEVGTITYKFDSDSNCSSPSTFLGLLVSKTDARGIRTCAQYDALNRETVLNYSNSDPTITTTYDQSACLGLSACQNIGQRTGMTDAAGSEAWAYQVDATNQRDAHANQRTTNGIMKPSTYYLDLAGNLTQVVYPTGRTVNYTYDAANRPKTAADASNGITYATDFQSAPTGCLSGAVCYTPQGTFYALSIGQATGFTGLNLTHTYNNRLQPNEFKASSSGGNAIDISYNFVDSITGHNAGHVEGITNNLDTTRSQTFSYDSLNRITGALTTSTHATSPGHCWGESYTLDAWANLNSIAATTNPSYTGCTVESGFSTTADGNNHLPTWGYDASGNATSDGFVTNYQWDAESQLKSAAGVTYTYDGDGRRVAKVGSKLYWYGSGGDILAETDASGNTQNEYIFFGGKRIAMLPASGSAQFYVEDLLGTSRVVTTNTGVVCYDADFYPYGGERTPYTNNCPTTNNYKFEGKERDTETGNDDFGARYYSNRFGRWLSADWSAVPVPVPYANLSNPQTLNLYSMVADDPESFADLDGHECFISAPGGISCHGEYRISQGGTTGEGSSSPNNSGTNGQGSSQNTQAQAQAQADQNANRNQDQNQSSGVPAPTNPDGTPTPPTGDVPKLPDGKPPGWKPGDPLVPNDWKPGEGTPDRPVRWDPKYPIPGQSQPNVSWDDKGHWDYNNGKGDRTRWLPKGGGQVDHNNRPIPASPISGVRTFVHAHPIATAVGGAAVVLGAAAVIVLSGGTGAGLLPAAAAAF